MKVRRARVWLVVASVVGALAFSPAVLRGQSPGQRVDQEFAALQAAIAALAQRVTALEHQVVTPAPVVPPVVVPRDAPALSASVAWTVAGEAGTFTLSETDVTGNGKRIDWNGQATTNFRSGLTNYVVGFRVASGVLFAQSADQQWRQWVGDGWLATTADGVGTPVPLPPNVAQPPPGGWVPPPVVATGPIVDASPDGTVVDRPWQPINGLAGNPQEVITLVMSDRKGSKDGGAHYIGYECGRVFDAIVPGLAEQIPWTPATDDGLALPPRWVPLDESYQPIADGTPAFKFALIAGEHYGYSFKVATAHGGILYQFTGKGIWYGPGGTVPDPLAPPPVLPAAAVGPRALIGGWRVPATWGSLAIDFTTMRAILGTGDHTQASPMLEVQLPPMGTGTDPSQWPEVIITGEKKPWWGYGFAQGVIFWRGKWWVCPRTYYAKDGATELPVVLFAEDGEQIAIPSIQRQAFGGFIKRGPELDPLIGGGGNESGEGWVPGPTVATLAGEVLLTWEQPGTLRWDGRAPREPNYAPIWGLDGWPALAPRNGEGRWASDRVYGGGLMLDGRVNWWALMGVGVIDYGLQNDTFAVSNETDRYQFDLITKALTYERTGLGAVRGQEIDADGRVYLSIVTPQPIIAVFAAR